MPALKLDQDRFFSANPDERAIARRLYGLVRNLPILSPHGHVDPAWFADNQPFEDAASLLITPDHYLLRMLYSQGVSLEALGIAPRDGGAFEQDGLTVWRTFAAHYHLFAGTPSQAWLDYAFAEIFGLDVALTSDTADHYFDAIGEALASEEFKPRALLDKFNIEKIATTEGALDDLAHHQKLGQDGLAGRIVTTFRPDDVLDPDQPDFANNIARLGAITNENTASWHGYLTALRARRAFFQAHGATATDHGHPTCLTADLPEGECIALFAKCLDGDASAAERELFRGQMLTEMAGMSLEDGMTMQIHPGAFRNHNQSLFQRFGADIGGDVPAPISYVEALQPLLNKFGNEPALKIILFTLDESTYARELAPLAGHYPALKLGPPWWFHDSIEGMLRYRHQVTESAGFYNTVGFNDDTRALLSIPARHDLARRMDARFLASLVAEHRMTEDQAATIIHDLTDALPRAAYGW